MDKKGIVYLVGAGPGRPDLITVRGADLIRQADCILCDKLANPALLARARSDAEIIHTPKRIGAGSVSQDQINELLVSRAMEGKTVVRLKGGDPCLFGRAAEELAVLTRAGIEFEIVPGVTAAIAAGAYSGILLTDRDLASQVVFVTGQEAEGKVAGSMDWAWLAACPGTLVFYMAMGHLDLIKDRLVRNGLDPDTPVAVVADATLSTQRTVRTRLDRVSQDCLMHQVEPPAIVIIGKVAGTGDGLDWFVRKPLFGKTIVLTRDARGNAEASDRIIAHGGCPIAIETIRLRPLTQTRDFLQVAARIAQYDWIVFTSGRGVEYFFDYLEGMGKDARALGHARVAAIGPSTKERLKAFGVRADLVPEVYTSAQLGRHMVDQADLKGKAVLLLRSDLADDQLKCQLAAAGAGVDQAAVYTTETVRGEGRAIGDLVRQGRVDWILFASPSQARSFFEQVPVSVVNAAHAGVASIGPVTSRQLHQIGVRIDVEAAEHSIDGLFEAILRA